MGYYMISESDMRKEQYNQQIEESKNRLDIEQFMMFFGAILHLACDFGFVSSAKKSQIEEILVKACLETGNAVLAANNMYVLSLYLQQLKPSDALEKLISEDFQVHQFLNESERWFKTEVRKLSGILNVLRPKIIKLNNSPITGAFTQLNKEVNSLMCFNSNPIINLKSRHINYCIGSVKSCLNYAFLEEDKKASNYLKLLKERIDDFYTEISIMLKLNGKYALDYIEKVQKNFAEQDESKVFAIESDFQKRLEEAKAIYQEQMEKAREFNAWFATLDDDEMEKIPEEDFEKYDDVVIEKAYNEARNKILQEWSAFDENSTKSNDEGEFSEKDALWFQATHPSLEFLAKEFTLCFLSEQRICFYPTEALEKVRFVDNISTVLAVWVLLEFSGNFTLRESEIKYLQNYYNNNGGDVRKENDLSEFKSFLNII